MRDDIASFCLRVLNEGNEFDQFNSINIVLIPKVSNPKNMVNFRPISLCKVLYKILAKVISNRFRRFWRYALIRPKALLY